MHLVQVYLPLRDSDGQRFSRVEYVAVEQIFVARFNGFTAYRRAPATGLWRSPTSEVQEDELVIYEVLVETMNRAWWSTYRKSLEKQFRQEQILIRSHPIEIL
jgi:hypothetical protein